MRLRHPPLPRSRGTLPPPTPPPPPAVASSRLVLATYPHAPTAQRQRCARAHTAGAVGAMEAAAAAAEDADGEQPNAPHAGGRTVAADARRAHKALSLRMLAYAALLWERRGRGAGRRDGELRLLAAMPPPLPRYAHARTRRLRCGRKPLLRRFGRDRPKGGYSGDAGPLPAELRTCKAHVASENEISATDLTCL
eukprot:365350-Chlamydomonas_euryale.AAC.4